MGDYYGEVFEKAQAEQPKPESKAKTEGPGEAKKRKRRVYGYRINDADAARVKALAKELGTSQDALMRALVPAILEAVDKKWLSLTVTSKLHEAETADGAIRAWATREVRSGWKCDPNSGTSGQIGKEG